MGSDRGVQGQGTRSSSLGSAHSDRYNQGGTGLGDPDRIENLGETQLPYSVFLDFVLSLGENKFKAGSWDLVRLNSNSFSDEVCQFVVGCGLPKYVLDLPPDMRNTPEICTQLGRISLPQFTGISLGLIGEGRGDVSRRADSPEFEELQAQIDALRADQLNLEQRRNAANIRETKKEKKKTKEQKKKKKKRKEEKRRKNSEESSCFSPTPTCCDIETCKPKPSPQSILKEREEQVFRCMKALAKFCSISRETPQLVKMIGPDPS